MNNQKKLVRKINIPPRSNEGIILTMGETYKIIAASEKHKNRVKITITGKSGNDIFYLIENTNDSPIFVEIY